MTSKALLGLVGGGSAAAGLGAGYGAGTKTKFPYKYPDLMNTLYSTLISKAESENAAYKKIVDDTEQNNFLLDYMGEICGIAKDVEESFNSDSAKAQLKTDKEKCGDTFSDLGSDKSYWVTHLQNRPQMLKEEWAEFKKYIYEKTTSSQ